MSSSCSSRAIFFRPVQRSSPAGAPRRSTALRGFDWCWRCASGRTILEGLGTFLTDNATVAGRANNLP